MLDNYTYIHTYIHIHTDLGLLDELLDAAVIVVDHYTVLAWLFHFGHLVVVYKCKVISSIMLILNRITHYITVDEMTIIGFFLLWSQEPDH